MTTLATPPTESVDPGTARPIEAARAIGAVRARSRRRLALVVLIGAAAAVVLALCALLLGAASLTPDRVLAALFGERLAGIVAAGVTITASSGTSGRAARLG